MSTKNLIYLAGALTIVVAAIMLSGELSIYINPAGILLVMGGTMAGVLLAFPMESIQGLFSHLKKMHRNKPMSTKKLIALFVRLARLQRTEGIRTIEEAAQASGHQFLAMGVGMVNDGWGKEDIRERLEQEFDFLVSRREAQRAVLSLAGRLAPAFGLAGTMIGLIRMLHTIKDPSAITEGMSVALLTTFYGIMLANLIILPLERKLNEMTRTEAVEMTLITEGVMGLCEEENGAAIQARLGSFRFARTGEATQAGAGSRRELKKLMESIRQHGRMARGRGR